MAEAPEIKEKTNKKRRALPSFQDRRALPPFPRLSGRLYIFPAFIPLIEIIPWLLTGLGALAGITQVTFWHRHRKRVFGFMALCFMAAFGIVMWQKMHIPDAAQGSRPIAPAHFSKLKTFKDATPQPASSASASNFSLLWTVDTPHETLATPVFADNLILTGTFAGTEEARLRTDGSLVWSLKKNEPIFANVVAAKNRAFVGEGLHTAAATVLTAFSLPDGKPVWERQFLSHLEAAVAVDESQKHLWLGAGDEGVWCLDAQDGSPIWHRKIGHVDATPLIWGDRLYTTAWPDLKKDFSALFALEKTTGKILWQVKLQGHQMGSAQASVQTGDVLATTAMGQVGPQKSGDKGWAHAVTRKGKLRWTVALPGLPLPEGSVLEEAGLVIYTLKTGQIVALNLKDGSVNWQVQQGQEFDAPATLNTRYNIPILAAISKDGLVVVRAAQSGAELYRFQVEQGGYAAPVFDGDKMYLTTPRHMRAYEGVHFLIPAVPTMPRNP